MKAIPHDLLQEGRNVPWTKLCAVLGVPRSSAYYIAREKTPRRMIDPVLERRIKELIETQAAFGIRSVWSWLRFVDGLQINRKKVERIMRLRRWTLKARRAGQRPRVQASCSIAEAPNQRWATATSDPENIESRTRMRTCRELRNPRRYDRDFTPVSRLLLHRIGERIPEPLGSQLDGGSRDKGHRVD